MSDLASRLLSVNQAIVSACKRAGRDSNNVTLVAVSKRRSSATVREYITAAELIGVPVVFGESYVQELKIKRDELAINNQAPPIHLIGPLQSNKIRDAVRFADVIESVHSLKVIQGIAEEARRQSKQQAIFLQVNIGQDPAKSGFAVAQLAEALYLVRQHRDHLSLKGLMTITPLYLNPEDARGDFRALNALRQKILESAELAAFEGGVVRLSMGMSADFEVAIEEGADLVRVGSAIFDGVDAV